MVFYRTFRSICLDRQKRLKRHLVFFNLRLMFLVHWLDCLGQREFERLLVLFNLNPLVVLIILMVRNHLFN